MDSHTERLFSKIGHATVQLTTLDGVSEHQAALCSVEQATACLAHVTTREFLDRVC